MNTLVQYTDTKAEAITLAAFALVKDVKEYALANYNKGWDIVIETMEDSEIAQIIVGSTTVMGAKRKMSAHISPFIDYARDIKGA